MANITQRSFERYEFCEAAWPEPSSARLAGAKATAREQRLGMIASDKIRPRPAIAATACFHRIVRKKRNAGVSGLCPNGHMAREGEAA